MAVDYSNTGIDSGTATATGPMSVDRPPHAATGDGSRVYGDNTTIGAGLGGMGLSRILSAYTRDVGRLSPEGEAYIETLRNVFDVSYDGGISVHRIGGNSWTGVGICAKQSLAGNGLLNGIILLMAEGCVLDPAENKTVLSAYGNIATDTFAAKYGDKYSISQIVTITREDYSEAKRAADIYANYVLTANNPQCAITVDTIKDYDIFVSFNRDDYERALRCCDPHGVKARADIKLTVSLRSRNPNSAERYDDFIVIGAYTDFKRNTESFNTFGGAREIYRPIVHITQLGCRIANQRVLPYILYIANVVLISNNHWCSQFNDITGVDNVVKPNIGNLLTDADGQLFYVTDILQRNAVIAECCDQPWLVLDVVTGRFHLPGMEAYAVTSHRGVESVNRLFNNFIGINDDSAANIVPGQLFARDMIGYIPNSDSVVAKADSRYVDYLNTIAHNKNNPEGPRALLHYYNSIKDSCDVVTRLIPDTKFYYDRYLVTLNGELNARIGQCLGGVAIHLPNSDSYTSGTVNMNSINNYGSTLNMGMGQYQGMRNFASSGFNSNYASSLLF